MPFVIREKPLPQNTRCAVCDEPGATPSAGHMTPLCHGCERLWRSHPGVDCDAQEI